MKYRISLTESAKMDIEFFSVNDRRMIVGGMFTYLANDAEVPTKRRKALRPNPIAPWELRLEDFRVFYAIEEVENVKIIAVGRKIHNDLYVRGEKVQL